MHDATRDASCHHTHLRIPTTRRVKVDPTQAILVDELVTGAVLDGDSAYLPTERSVRGWHGLGDGTSLIRHRLHIAKKGGDVPPSPLAQ